MAGFIDVLETPNSGQAGHIAATTRGNQGQTLARLTDAAINRGLGVVDGATVGQTCKAPASAAEVRDSFLGVLIDPEFKNEIGNSTTYDAGEQASILEEGIIWVPVEKAVAIGDLATVRHTSDGGSNTELGKWRDDSDYPAGGITLTPVVADSTLYSVNLFDGKVRETYTYLSDATATAQEIVEGLATKINAGTAFDATEDDSTISITSVTGILEIETIDQFAFSTPARCALVPGAKFLSATSGAGVAKLRLPNPQ